MPNLETYVMSRSLSKSILIAPMALLIFSGSVMAGDFWNSYDRKVYTGAQCQPAWGNQSADFTIFAGTLRNMAAGNRWASCALTFDQEGTVSSADTDNTTSAGALSVLVRLDYSAVAAGPEFTTNCSVRSVEPSGTSTVVADSVTSTKTASSREVLFTTAEMGAFDGSLSIGSHDSIQVSCLLPPAVAIEIVKIYEYGDTGAYRYIP